MGQFLMLMIKVLISSVILLLIVRGKKKHARIRQPSLLSQEKQILCFPQGKDSNQNRKKSQKDWQTDFKCLKHNRRQL